MILYGKLTLRYFFLIQDFSSSKLLEILCALCKSPRIAFRLYFSGNADDQWLGILNSFMTTDVSVIPFLTLFFLMFPFDPLENISKPLVFWCLQEDRKGILGRKGLIIISVSKTLLGSTSIFNFILRWNFNFSKSLSGLFLIRLL